MYNVHSTWKFRNQKRKKMGEIYCRQARNVCMEVQQERGREDKIIAAWMEFLNQRQRFVIRKVYTPKILINPRDWLKRWREANSAIYRGTAMNDIWRLEAEKVDASGPLGQSSSGPLAPISMCRLFATIWLRETFARAPVIYVTRRKTCQPFRRSYLSFLLFPFFYPLTDTREMRSIASSENLFQCASVLNSFFLLASHFDEKQKKNTRDLTPRILYPSDDISRVLKVNYIRKLAAN